MDRYLTYAELVLLFVHWSRDTIECKHCREYINIIILIYIE